MATLENLIGETGMGIAVFVLIMAAVFWAFAPFAIFGLKKHLEKVSSEMTALVDEIAALREALEGRRHQQPGATLPQRPEAPRNQPAAFAEEATAQPQPGRREPILGAPTRTSASGLRANRDE
ncbi:hypothetical protein [Gimibacter soli]|uniref:Uncharacterized protein n=1 Tax=Gimibacter soli TaxID=3024400 RepID=A0AAE9XPW8_9PROT|nr:hypothetical protein [Gimibacter soli]WCL55088.1 hypothetical protein PH603_04870 [Gimibacter soli]